MYNDNNNSDFLSYQGRINRKNYVINLLILFSIYIALHLIRFDAFFQFFTFKFFETVLIFLVDMLKFVVIVSALSVIYRRISDFSNFGNKMRMIFFWFFGFPFIYLWLGHYMLDFLPGLLNILDMAVYFFFLPVSVILTIVFAFIKSK